MPFAWFVFALVALIATLSVTEMVRVFAHRLRAVDRPGGRRLHRRPTARLGGLGIYWGFFAALAIATYGEPLMIQGLAGADFGLIGMMVGASMLLIVGVMDDVYGLRATLKLVFQIGAALVLFGFGWRVEMVGIPGIGAWSVGSASLPLTVFWVLLVTNALNLIDGLDGLACGVALVATLGACVLLAPSGGALLLVAAALAGALIGFLWFNIHPALIFMGDAGSLFVGFLLSAITLRAGQMAAPEAFPVVPALLLLVPLYDTFDAILRRAAGTARSAPTFLSFLRRVAAQVFSPDGFHVHHRLVRAGFSMRQSVVLLWGVATAFASAACLIAVDALAGGLLIVTLAALVVWANRVLRSRISATMAPSIASPIAATVVLSAEGSDTSESHPRAA